MVMGNGIGVLKRIRPAQRRKSSPSAGRSSSRCPGGLLGVTMVVPHSYLDAIMAVTTTIKLPEKLKARIARLAKATGRSPHSLMVEALEREVSREERMKAFVGEALAAKAKVEEGGAVYRAEDVHAWMERLATG